MNLSIALRQRARLKPTAPAVSWDRAVWDPPYAPGGALDYAGFETLVARLAGGLRHRLGLRPGQRVAMAMANAPEFLPTLFGVWRAGLVAAPLNSKLHPREFADIFADLEAAVVVATPALAETLAAGGPPVIATESAEFAALLAADPVEAVDTVGAGPGDPAWIFFTSGTTGRSKGAILTFRNLLAMSWAYFADIDQVSPGDVQVHAAPMSHGSGLYGLPFVLAGAENLVTPGFDPDRLYDLMRDRRRVSFFAAPTMVGRLTAHRRAGEDVSGLKTLCYGGAPMYVADCRRALAQFGPRLYQLYGQGEAPMTISHVSKAMHAEQDRPDFEALLGSAGCARTGVEIGIVDDAWRFVPPGETGEIVTRSDVVMAGYLDNPEATAKALCGGWLKTGDVGVIDAAGILTLQDRSKDLIISGGSNIYPREVEEALLAGGAVAEAAVVGAPHPDWGEEVVAFVVPAPGAAPDPAALDALCLARLARFKRPRRYLFETELPKNNYGKILKRALRERLSAR